MTTAIRLQAPVWEQINPTRIAAISATLAIHAMAFGLLMVPLSLPEVTVRAQEETELTIVVPPPNPIVLKPLPIKPVDPVASRPLPPAVESLPQADITSPEPALFGPEELSVDADPDSGVTLPGEIPGGEVDASTRSRYPIEYPKAALRSGVGGTVIVLAMYDAEGTVTDTQIHQSSRDRHLDRAALVGVRKWKINPRQVQGQAVGGQALVEVRFNR